MEFRLRDFAHPLAILRLRRLLAASEWWDEDRMAAWQAARLRELLVHARDTVPFWRRRLEQAGVVPERVGDPADLRRLPVLTKDEVRAAGEALRSSAAGRYAPRRSSTSGSTGTALQFWLDRPTNVLEFATLWRQFNRAGYRFGQRFADLRGHLVRASSGIERDRRLNALNLSAFDFTRERARAYARALGGFAPVMVRGYPSSIAILARWALEDGVELPSPRAVVTSSETLLADQRRVIERAFRAPVYDYYGQMERVAFAGQCPAGCWHVAGEYGIVELLDESGAEVPPGVPGRIVATGLHHRAMPFVRYETRDLAVRAERPCPCGRTGLALSAVWGRLEDVIVTPEGRHVGRLDAALKDCLGIRLAQIVQEDPSAIEVRLVAGASWDAGEQRRLVHELRRRLGERIAIAIRPVEAIPLDRSGKLKFVISKVAPSAPPGGLGYHRDA